MTSTPKKSSKKTNITTSGLVGDGPTLIKSEKDVRIISTNCGFYNKNKIWVVGADTNRNIWVYHTLDNVFFPLTRAEFKKIDFVSKEEEKNYIDQINITSSLTFRPYKIKLNLDGEVKEFFMPAQTLWVVFSKNNTTYESGYIESENDKKFIGALSSVYKSVSNVTLITSEIDDFKPTPRSSALTPPEKIVDWHGEYVKRMAKLDEIMNKELPFGTYTISIPNNHLESITSVITDVGGSIKPSFIEKIKKLFIKE